MKRMLLAIGVCLVFAGVATAEEVSCDACMKGICFTTQPFDALNGYPLAVDNTANILYIKYKDHCGFDIVAAVHLKDSNRVETVLREVVAGATVDQVNSDVYLYSYNSLHKYNPISKKLNNVPVEKGMAEAHFKNKLYFTNAEKLHYGLYELDVSTNHTELITPTANYSIFFFQVDRNSDVYFFGRLRCEDLDESCRYGMYRLRNGSNKLEYLFHSMYKLYLDGNEVVYFFDDFKHKIFKMTAENDRLELVGSVKENNKYNVVFDSANRMYYHNDTPSFAGGLYYISPIQGSSCDIEDCGKKACIVRKT